MRTTLSQPRVQQKNARFQTVRQCTSLSRKLTTNEFQNYIIFVCIIYIFFLLMNHVGDFISIENQRRHQQKHPHRKRRFFRPAPNLFWGTIFQKKHVRFRDPRDHRKCDKKV